MRKGRLLVLALLASLLASCMAAAHQEPTLDQVAAVVDQLLATANEAFGPLCTLDAALGLASNLSAMAAFAPPPESLSAHAQLIVNLLEGSDGEFAGHTSVEELRPILSGRSVESQDLWVPGFSSYDSQQLFVASGGAMRVVGELRRLVDEYRDLLTTNIKIMYPLVAFGFAISGASEREGEATLLASTQVFHILMERVEALMHLCHQAAVDALVAEDRATSVEAFYRFAAYADALRGCECQRAGDLPGLDSPLGSVVFMLWGQAEEFGDMLAQELEPVD